MGRSKSAKVSAMSIMKRIMAYATDPSTQVKTKTRKKKQK
jgi:hypothetical protein